MMERATTRWLYVGLAAVAAAGTLIHVQRVGAIGAGYTAKIVCSGVFVSKLGTATVLAEEAGGMARIFRIRIDPSAMTVKASLPGVPDATAIYRPGIGCTLLQTDADIAALRMEARGEPRRPPRQQDVFDEPLRAADPRLVSLLEAELRDVGARTRAIVVVKDGRIVAETYAPGISSTTALPGWSMTKSVAGALIGTLLGDDMSALGRPPGLPEWSKPGDPRADITLDQLLRMSSGLRFDERSGPVDSDVNRMLLRARDASAYAIAKPLRRAPGTHWSYSSGSTNILSRFIRDRTRGDRDFPRRALFDRIGMESAVVETDAAGNFVFSSFMLATARDWARFGQLLLQDGAWAGVRVLPSGWAAYCARPAPANPDGGYGAHFWTNAGIPGSGRRPLPRLPPDTFYAKGYEGQYMVVIPSRRTVVVRLGQTRRRIGWDMEGFVSSLLSLLP